jgi:phosphoribosyl 1,2-cyclic phosphate phosphodiesterase
MKGIFQFLGTGGSTGVPLIGCCCEVCTSPSSYNKRLRSSGLITVNGKRFLIDVGPDFRSQALAYKIDDLTGVLITHAHADHIAGIDDLRAYYFKNKKSLPCLLSKETFDEVSLRYHYLMKPLSPGKSVAAQIEFRQLQSDFGTVEFEGLSLHFLSYFQNGMKVTGFRFGNFAYVSDIREFTEEVISSIEGIDHLVLSALRHEPTQMHFSLEEAIAFSRRVGAKKTYLTHIAHDLEYATTTALLPPEVCMSYDGMQIAIQIPDQEIR